MVAGLLGGYFYALWLGPEDYGIWKTALMLAKYAGFLTLGIPFAMRRDFIQLRSSGNQVEAEKMAQITLSFGFITSIIATVCYILSGLVFNDNPLLSISLIAIGILQLFSFFYEYGKIINAGYNRYNIISRAEGIKSILQILTLPLVYFYGFNALLFSILFIHLSASIYYYRTKPFPVKWRLDLRLLKKMLFIGLPLFFSSILSIVFVSIDRLLIAYYLSFNSVGYYSLGALVITPIVTLLTSFGGVLFTRLNEKHGFRRDKRVIEEHVLIPQVILSKFIPPLIGIGIIALPLLTNLLLPEYEDGILAAQIRIFAIYSQVITMFSANALFVMDKHKLTVVFFAMAGIINTAGSILALKAGYGIEGVALATVIGYIFYDNSMLYAISSNLGMSYKEFLKVFFSKMTPLIAVFFFGLIILTKGPDFLYQHGIQNVWLHFLLSEITMIICCIPIFFIGIKQIRLKLAA